MRSIHFEESAFDEFMEWSKEDKKVLQRITKLIQECRRTPLEGIGKPEALRGNLSSFWSRRIDEKNRLIYKVTDDQLIIYSLKGHYDD